VKGFFIFGRPKRRRLAMTFGYECRPSFWRSVRSNSHLVIAGLGTASFLGIAGLALWLAMPSGERAAFADTRQEAAESQLAAATAVTEPAAAPEAPTAQAAPRGDEVTPETAAAEAQLPTLKSNNIRWNDPNAPDKPAASAQASRQAVDTQAAAADAKPQEEGDASPLAAFAAANRAQVGGNTAPAGAKPDTAATAAIPTAKPKIDPAPAKEASAANGRTVHAVTMRSGPKKGASAMTTVPAGTEVQVISCSQWCEIIYKDKRGWVYKTYVKRD